MYFWVRESGKWRLCYVDIENLDFCFEMSFNCLKESMEGYDFYIGCCVKVYCVKVEFYFCIRMIRRCYYKERIVYKDCNYCLRKDLDGVSFKKC